MTRVMAAVCALVVGASCGDTSGPSSPNLRGEYDVVYTVAARDVEHNHVESATCPGVISVTSQSGKNFSGIATWKKNPSGGCIDKTGTLSGTVTSDRAVLLRLSFPGSTNAFGMQADCPFVIGSDEFHGLFANDRITVSASATARCTAGAIHQDVELLMHIIAVRL